MLGKPKNDIDFIFWILGVLLLIWIIWVITGGPQKFEEKNQPFIESPIQDAHVE
ncbi:hypothetical protein KC842_01855 [Candidatus Nomurabacteria bacterium]|nr:hypothetical protein [Candidatus Nomurabacteria bacterium]USN94646.1 MAG: hypothetical protein H6791_02725 [Candidatus Nomurabacteria bacterium]